MFGDGPEVDPEELDSEAIKEMWAEAHKAEETDKTIMVSKLPIVPEFGIDPDYLPELVTIRE